MKKFTRTGIKILFLLFAFNHNILSEEWPKIIEADNDAEITFYQPQIEAFSNISLETRAAIMIKPEDKEPIWGAVWVKAKILTDSDSREIELEEVQVTDAKFPGQDSAKIEELKKFLAEEIIDWDIEITVDDLLASLELEKTSTREKFKSDPPEIIHVNYPAVLITIDGDPVFKKLPDTPYEYVINTPFFIIKDKDEELYYLKGGLLWYEAENILDEWEWTDDIPDDLIRFVKAKSTESQVEVDPDTIDVKPQIIVKFKPAELIETFGEPELAPVKSTSLLFVKNSESDIIMDIESQMYFIVVSGRWFQAKSLTGPWNFVEPDSLPADFKNIPGDSEIGNVLVHIPGTEESKDAILETQIPQTAKVDRTKTIEVKYDGEPKFEEIKESELQYAVNTDKSVIKFNETYYCCDNAVWYESSSPTGPWAVTISVPDEIYEMNPESPVYNVKYVYVYDSTPEVVYVGYYPGYAGCYVYNGAVIYGTGYYYQPWYGAYYYPRPVTYGFSMHYNPYSGWSFGFGMSFGGPYGFFSIGISTNPYYGGYWGAGGYHAGYRHGYYDGRRTGFYAGYKYAERNPGSINSGRNQVSHLDSERNRNLYKDQGTGVNTNDRQRNRDQGAGVNTNDVQRNRDNASTMDRQKDNPSAANRQGDRAGTKNDVFTDKQGNVYKRDNNEWKTREGNNWEGADKSKDRSSFERNQQDLEKQRASREKASVRNQNFSQQRSGQFRGGGGGGRGGGRRR